MTEPQQKWLLKLMGYDFSIEFKKGKNNIAADALSRKDTQGEFNAVSSPLPQWLESIKKRIYLPSNSELIPIILQEIHGIGHEGLYKTLHRVNEVWIDISMDFIDGLPPSKGKIVLVVVVDWLSKYAHFIPMSHPYTAPKVAQTFFENVFKLHGMPSSIVCDRDSTFISAFWKELFKLQGTSFNFNSSYHPQTDGQTEVVNRTLEMYLRCFTSSRPKEWVQWVPWAEFCCNTSLHASTRKTPFEVVYGREPPNLLSYVPGTSKVEAVDNMLQARDKVVKDLRCQLQQAQARMKTAYDQGRVEREFVVGDWVYLRLRPYRQTSLSLRHHINSPRDFMGHTVC
ncbi:Transposon Ty3-I Gag-Pol polyprotein [Vitis vinifera]|uniref:Transposon Ty3-I Gag-Pol polyprotein n=1 Tax=Vitis vinifera TaxID=29760 RepID=A0A438JDT3_VITVI|nr:Transposon Ty3-I Gag-Pol polyprotein [Vitis vinifera]